MMKKFLFLCLAMTAFSSANAANTDIKSNLNGEPTMKQTSVQDYEAVKKSIK